MKNSFKITILALIAVIAFSSCNSGLSITKRRYNKGYYVHHSTKPSDPKHKEVRKMVQQPAENTEKETLATNAWEQSSPNAFPQSQEQPVVTAKAPIKNNSSVKNNPKATNITSTIQLAIKEPVKTIKKLSTEIKSSPAAGEALSLLWILIVILLIAYVLGLLFDNFGLGWVIHILLVVILVLLILWLLRLL